MTAPASRTAAPTRVLLADDSEGLRLLVRSWLSALDDLEVVAEASNGAEALALTDAHLPDVVVLDVAMPVMDGLEALTELRRRFPDLPVVMLSGFAERDVAAQAADRGACAFVEKCGDLDPLVDAVRRAAAGPLPRPRPAPDEPSRPASQAAPVPDPPPAPVRARADLLPSALVLLAFPALVGAQLAAGGRHPLLVLLCLPVLVLAVRHGVRGGLAAGLLAAAVQVLEASTVPGVGALDGSRLAVAAVLVVAGGGVGAAITRAERRSAHDREAGATAAATNRRLAEANEQLSLLNRELEATNGDLRQFGYVVGHDLAEPLRTMSSFARLLQRRYGDALGRDGGQYVSFIVGGTERLQALITDLRDYTRTGQADLSLQPVALDDVVRDVLASLRSTLDERAAVVRAGSLPVVRGDRSMLGLVVQNLVTNALRFNRSDAPVVEIDAERAATAWRITVSDNGIGIAPDATERVFALFSRLHRHEDYPGTGLGLAITKRIVERHGGSVRIAPRPQGGTVVTVELPAPAEAPAA